MVEYVLLIIFVMILFVFCFLSGNYLFKLTRQEKIRENENIEFPLIFSLPLSLFNFVKSFFVNLGIIIFNFFNLFLNIEISGKIRDRDNKWLETGRPHMVD